MTSRETARRRDATGTWEGIHGTLAMEEPAPGVVVLRIVGHDVGEFGAAPMRALEARLSDDSPIDLFIDARDTLGASIEVSGEWALWLGAHREDCAAIRMLAGSRFLEITAEFVRRFANLGDAMRIYTDAAAFDEALGEAVGRARAARPAR